MPQVNIWIPDSRKDEIIKEANKQTGGVGSYLVKLHDEAKSKIDDGK